MIQDLLRAQTAAAVKSLFGKDLDESKILINLCNKDQQGDYTVVVFPISKEVGGNPEEVGKQIGEQISEDISEVTEYNVVKGFLNLSLSDQYWKNFVDEYDLAAAKSNLTKKTEKIVIEYCSPNTNKPLHLGHLRNIFLGSSLAKILKGAGYEAVQVCLYNDRGTNISKSMLAWSRWGEGAEPVDIKGDKFVGDYYVKFAQEFKKEQEALMADGKSKEQAEAASELNAALAEMTQAWEDNDAEVRALWKKMNDWVYQGFEQTYQSLGIQFDDVNYESETYLLGKDIIAEGIKTGLFTQKEDGSVWIDLTEDGLDEKLLLRSDGTSVYITQDLGTAIQRHQNLNMDRGIYVVGNEQDYHFKVLFMTLQKAEHKWAEKLFHLSYGMVELPSGKMKSREGTVVDADDLVAEMIKTAKEHTQDLGKIQEFSQEEAERLYQTIGMGALKFHLLKIDPRKGIMFDPQESIDFHGHTGPFIQYVYARIQSILRKKDKAESVAAEETPLDQSERDLAIILNEFPLNLNAAAEEYDPSILANYVFNLAKTFNKFYAEVSVLNAPDNVRELRVKLAENTASVLKECMGMLGISVPERM